MKLNEKSEAIIKQLGAMALTCLVLTGVLCIHSVAVSPVADQRYSGTNYVWTSNQVGAAFQAGLDAKCSDPYTKLSYVTNLVSTGAVSSATYNAGTNTLKGFIDGKLAIASNLSDLANANTARGNLGLALGTNVQPYDADLSAIAGLTSAADKLPYFTGSGTAGVTDFSSFARTLLDDANAGIMRSTLGVALGTNAQPYDLDLESIAALTPTKGRIMVGDGTNWITKNVGTDGQVLKSDSTVLGGVAWLTLGGGGDMVGANNLTDVADANASRGNLGLAIGTNVLAFSTGVVYHADLGVIVQRYGAKLENIRTNSYSPGDILYVDAQTNMTRLPKGSAGQVLTIGATIPSWATPAASGGGAVGRGLIEHREASGTSGGTATASGSFDTHTLTSVVYDNQTNVVAFGTNAFTLRAGTYYFKWRACGYQVNVFQTRLLNTTDSTLVALGSAEVSAAADNVTVTSFGEGYTTITTNKTFELQMRVQTTKATEGWGYGGGAYGASQFATVSFEKE